MTCSEYKAPSMGKSQGTPLLAAAENGQRAQQMAALNSDWLFPWNLPWTNRGTSSRNKIKELSH